MNRDTDSIKQSDPIPSSIHLNTLETRTGVESITYGKVSQKLRSNRFLEITKFSNISFPIPSSIHLNTLETRTGAESITYGKVSQKLRSNRFLEITKFSLDHYSCLFMFYVLIVKVEDSVRSNS